MMSIPVFLLLAALSVSGAQASPPQRITVIVDAFGAPSALARSWGYSALVEYGGRRILFDTGNDSAGFVANVERLGIDLTHLDAVVISHRHGDHTSGLRHVLAMNPDVPVYVPPDEAFMSETPKVFFRQPAPSLPPEQRYFGGTVPTSVPHGNAWTGARLVPVHDTMTIAPGFRLVRNVAPAMPFAETEELSLVFDTPAGQVVVVGCSHPGIERILASVTDRDPRIHMVAGGLHLVTTDDSEIARIAQALRDAWKVARIAPGHCTGERGFLALREVFGGRYAFAGIGAMLDIS